jgi:hypothetical protein
VFSINSSASACTTALGYRPASCGERIGWNSLLHVDLRSSRGRTRTCDPLLESPGTQRTGPAERANPPHDILSSQGRKLEERPPKPSTNRQPQDEQ